MLWSWITNLDLFAIGASIAATGILGFAVFFKDSKSSTNRAFLAFSLITICWGIANYVQYKVSDAHTIVWLLRIILIFAVWQAFSMYRLFSAFPLNKKEFSKKEKYLVIPAVIFITLLTLTPVVISRVEGIGESGGASGAANGWGIGLFGALSVGLVVAGIRNLWVKLKASETSIQRSQIYWIFIGASITFLFIIVFNFIFPAFLNIANMVPLGAVFFFPFIVFTFYSITRHGLFNARIAATEILTFILAIVSLFEVVVAESVSVLIFRLVIFTLVLFFSILLIRSVLKEVKQREELQALTEKLQGANTQLEQLSHFKTQLLSLASHQIKAPIAAIKGFATLLFDGLYGPISDKQKETVSKIRKSSDELIALINTLLDLRKVEEGKMEYKFAPEDVCEITQEIVEGLGPLAREKNIQLTSVCLPHKVQISADKEKFIQVVRNLVDNAIKYTPAGGFVHVGMKEAEGEVVISVADSGVGIPAELIPYLFEEFVRDDRIKAKIRGTGLGLYIARKIIEEHKGRIWAESEGENKGSIFKIAIKKV